MSLACCLIPYCVLSSFIIKPQLAVRFNYELCIVSYLLSSSNHNYAVTSSWMLSLCLIFFHHQTTTMRWMRWRVSALCLIFFHHQTTTLHAAGHSHADCVLSSFIIKPQPILYIPLKDRMLNRLSTYRKWRDEHQIICKFTKKIPVVPASAELFVLSHPKYLLSQSIACL